MNTDIGSENRLLQLHPKVKSFALMAYREAVRITPIGVHPYITETIRTFEKSDEYYAQGRTKPGSIITQAAGGASYHNYGLAIDFFIQKNGLPHWVVDDNWMKVVKCFKEHGFAWGGDFKSFKDNPHFEMTFGYGWRDLLKKYNAKDFIPGTKFVNL